MPVAFLFRGLVSGRTYAETWFFAADPLFERGAIPPRAARIWDTSPANLNAPADRFAAATYRRGELPLWNGAQCLGTPLAAEMNTPVLSPLRVLLLYLPGVTDYGTSLFFAVNVWVGACGVFLWLRGQGVSRIAALTVSLSYVFSGNVLEGFRFADLPGAMLAPYLLWRIDALVGRPRLWEALTLGMAAGATVLSAHVAGAFLALVAGAVYGVVRLGPMLVSRRTTASPRVRVIVVVAVIAAAAVSAVAWIPFLELLGEGWTYKLAAAGGTFVSCDARNIVIPHLYARCFLAAVPLVWAVGGATTPSRLRLPSAALLLVGAAIVFRPPVLGVVGELPGLRLFQGIYGQFVFALGVGGLAAAGLDALPRRPKAARRAFLVLAAGALLLYVRPPSPWPVGPPAGTPEHAREWFASRSTVALRTVAAASSFALIGILALRRRPSRRAALAALSWLAVALEVGPRAVLVVEPEPAFDLRETPAAKFLREHTLHGERVAALTHGRGVIGFTIHTPNAGLATGLADPRCSQALFVRRSHALLERVGAGGSFPTWLLLNRFPDALGGADATRTTGLEMLGVRYLLSPAGAATPSGLRRVYEDDRVAIDEDPGALGRAFVVHEAIPAGSPAEAERLLAEPGVNFRTQAVVEGLGSAPPSPAVTSSGADLEPVEIEAIAPREIHIRATVRSHAFLVLSDSFFPGWRAAVDGATARILPANLALRAVELEAGSHQVVFRYDPLSVKVGLGLGVAAALVWAASGLVRWRAGPPA